MNSGGAAASYFHFHFHHYVKVRPDGDAMFINSHYIVATQLKPKYQDQNIRTLELRDIYRIVKYWGIRNLNNLIVEQNNYNHKKYNQKGR